MLRKEVVIDKIEVLEKGHIQVRTITRIFDGKDQIGEGSYHRVAINPGASIDELHKHLPDEVSSEDIERVNTVSKAVWTPEVITEFEELPKRDLTKPRD